MSKFPILQSGFISRTEEHLTHPYIPKSKFSDFQLHVEYLKNTNGYFYSPIINDMYNKWLGNTKLHKNFDFREEILKEGMFLLGKDFGIWLALQSGKNTVGSLHKEFLIDCFTFILSGKRNMTPTQWVRLLEADTNAVPVTFSTNDIINCQVNNNLKGVTPVYNTLSSTKTSSLITKWTSQPQGFVDFMYSLFIIFGRRPYITDLSDKTV